MAPAITLHLAAAAVACGLCSDAGAGPAAGDPALLIPGHFSLQTVEGRPVTDARFHGKWLLVFFGYTSCPDVCPTVLLRVGAALHTLGPLAEQVQPIFITVDPERDSAERLREYLAPFDRSIIGLRGNTDQLQQAAHSFRAYFKRRPLGDGEYTVDHSSFLYVMQPDGRFAELLPDSISARELADEIQRLTRAQTHDSAR